MTIRRTPLYWDKAHWLCDRLLKEDFGRLNMAQKSYATFLSASLAYWTKDKLSATKLYMKAYKIAPRSCTGRRAAYAASNLMIWSSDKTVSAAIFTLLHRMLKTTSFFNTAEHERGWVLLAEYYRRREKDLPKAWAHLSSYPGKKNDRITYFKSIYIDHFNVKE